MSSLWQGVQLAWRLKAPQQVIQMHLLQWLSWQISVKKALHELSLSHSGESALAKLESECIYCLGLIFNSYTGSTVVCPAPIHL